MDTVLDGDVSFGYSTLPSWFVHANWFSLFVRFFSFSGSRGDRRFFFFL